MSITEETRRLAQARKARVVDLTREQVLALTIAWVAAWDDLEGELERIALDIANRYPDGAPQHLLDREQRVQEAIDVSHDRIVELVDYADARIAQDVEGIARHAVDTQRQVVVSQAPAGSRGTIYARFGGVNEEALAAMVARTTSRIHSETMPLTARMEDGMRRALTRGIAEGTNPRETARRMMTDLEGEFNGGLSRAARIARTESLDSFRAADQVTAEANSDLIAGQVWMATLDSATCMSCLSRHGTVDPPEAFGPLDHQNGRCTYVTQLKSWQELGIGDGSIPEPPPTIDPGEARRWFEGLTPDTQQAMLGPGKYDLWDRGELDWNRLSTRREAADWRAAYYETPLKDLLAA